MDFSDLIKTHPCAYKAIREDDKIFLFVDDLDITFTKNVPRKWQGLPVIGYKSRYSSRYIDLTVDELLMLKEFFLIHEMALFNKPYVRCVKFAYKRTRGFYDLTKPCICIVINKDKTPDVSDEERIPALLFDKHGNSCYTDIESYTDNKV
jgi:hypothetical protein